MIKKFICCGALAGLLFGAYCVISAKAAARGDLARVDSWTYVAVAIFGAVGAVGGLLAGAMVRLFVRLKQQPTKKHSDTTRFREGDE
jgi:hypothetical protein